jgi:hypothetical protein
MSLPARRRIFARRKRNRLAIAACAGGAVLLASSAWLGAPARPGSAAGPAWQAQAPAKCVARPVHRNICPT